MNSQSEEQNAKYESPKLYQDEVQQIRAGFAGLVHNFIRDIRHWENAGPVTGSESRRLAVGELVQILDDKKLFGQVETRSTEDKVLHDLRSAIAIVTNGISLLGLIEVGPEREKMVQLVTRNLERLADIADSICQEIHRWPHPEKMIALLLHTSVRLNKLITFESDSSAERH